MAAGPHFVMRRIVIELESLAEARATIEYVDGDGAPVAMDVSLEAAVEELQHALRLKAQFKPPVQ